jgi:Site-specific recombinases, DNA invertase Pin homologs
MEKEIKAVAYARVSSKEQAEKELSIPAQLEAIRNHCKQKGWKLVHEYIDAGKSAKTDERPEFQRMIAMAKRPNRGFDAIIVHKFDRFSRNRDDHVIYKSLLKKIGVTVYSVTEQADPETPHGFLLEGIMEVMSEFYNMNLKNEAMKGMRENAKQGFHNGGAAPYGYRTSKAKNSNGRGKSVWILGPDDEVNTIRLIYDLYIHHNKGFKAIVNELNNRKIPSPHGKLWSWTTVWHILHNEAYIGQKIWNKHDYSTGKKKKAKEEWIINASSHPAIIDRDTFNLVIKKSAERNPSGAAYKSTGPSLYILRGILKCPMCSANMITGSNSKYSRGKTRYYFCGTYNRKGAGTCKRNQVFKEDIENAVINALVREFSILSYPGSLEEEIRKYVESVNRETTFNISRIDDEIKHINKRIQLMKSEMENYKNKQYLDDYIMELESDIERLQNEKEGTTRQIQKPIQDGEMLKLVRESLRNFVIEIKTQRPEIQHELLKKYLNSVTKELSSDNFKLNYIISIPSYSLDGTLTKVLEKTIYFSLDS